MQKIAEIMVEFKEHLNHRRDSVCYRLEDKLLLIC